MPRDLIMSVDVSWEKTAPDSDSEVEIVAEVSLPCRARPFLQHLNDFFFSFSV